MERKIDVYSSVATTDSHPKHYILVARNINAPGATIHPTNFATLFEALRVRDSILAEGNF